MSNFEKMLCIVLILFAASLQINALDTTEFSETKHQVRYDALTNEFRCLVCQNESIAGSSSELAQDLRKLVAEQIRAGKKDSEIRDYMTQRYGDFVLYRPANKGKTKLLWMAPLLFLLLFGIVFIGILFTKNKTVDNDGEVE